MIYTRYKQRRRNAMRQKCAAMRAAKEHKRIERATECGTWAMRLCQFEASFSPCGRYVGLRAINGPWQRCGSERSVRGALANVLWTRGRQCTS